MTTGGDVLRRMQMVNASDGDHNLWSVKTNKDSQQAEQVILEFL